VPASSASPWLAEIRESMPNSSKTSGTPANPGRGQGIGPELEQGIHALIGALVDRDDAAYEAEFVHLLGRVDDLVHRKLRLEGTKSETRDLLGELLFTRMRRAMHQLLRSENDLTAAKAAQWVMGLMFSIGTLSEFAKAFDQSLLATQAGGQDFDFAGRTDFISVEEVMQMLAAGKHVGCLTLEKGDNRLDVYLKDGRIFFLDPHHIVRRVLVADGMRHREIPESAIAEAETRRVRERVPVLVSLVEKGVFKSEELRDVVRSFGKEVLFDFMREDAPYGFFYKRLDALPDYVETCDIRLGVTSVLLEGSKCVDDWRQMRTVFPDPDAPIVPKADMYQRMGDLALDVVEIKLLSQVNGDTTPRTLSATLGLPLPDVYQLLIRLCQEGILAPGGEQSSLELLHLGEEAATVEQSMEEAFAALAANDDDDQRRSAIDRVFGDADASSSLSALDKVLGGDAPPAPAKPDGKDLLGILRKGKNG
jgi:hypothetical protein